MVGGWCPVIYKSHFDNELIPTFRTFDVDFFLPHPIYGNNDYDINTILKDMDYIS